MRFLPVFLRLPPFGAGPSRTSSLGLSWESKRAEGSVCCELVLFSCRSDIFSCSNASSCWQSSRLASDCVWQFWARVEQSFKSWLYIISHELKWAASQFISDVLLLSQVSHKMEAGSKGKTIRAIDSKTAQLTKVQTQMRYISMGQCRPEHSASTVKRRP